jgi:ribonucleoside-triphosphate reductase
LNLAAQWGSEEELLAAQALSARAGLRMTLADMEMQNWDNVQKRDRLLGVSLTGVQDAGATVELLAKLRKTANEAATAYAEELEVNRPLLVTTVKPEGTLSQVAGGVSSGLHYSHSEYFIRRIRINAHDPLARVAIDLGWRVNPEVGQEWETATTLVIDFPVHSPAKKHKNNVNFKQQLQVYLDFQQHYTDHNSSNTIHMLSEEWSTAAQEIHAIWDDYIGISFLAHDGGTYRLAPYEACTKEQYEELRATMKPFNAEMLRKYDNGETLDAGDESCEGGACPVR